MVILLIRPTSSPEDVRVIMQNRYSCFRKYPPRIWDGVTGTVFLGITNSEIAKMVFPTAGSHEIQFITELSSESRKKILRNNIQQSGIMDRGKNDTEKNNTGKMSNNMNDVQNVMSNNMTSNVMNNNMTSNIGNIGHMSKYDNIFFSSNDNDDSLFRNNNNSCLVETINGNIDNAALQDIFRDKVVLPGQKLKEKLGSTKHRVPGNINHYTGGLVPQWYYDEKLRKQKMILPFHHFQDTNPANTIEPTIDAVNAKITNANNTKLIGQKGNFSSISETVIGSKETVIGSKNVISTNVIMTNEDKRREGLYGKKAPEISLPWNHTDIFDDNELKNNYSIDNFILFPLMKNYKIYFCSDCIVIEDDLKLQNILKRKFRIGNIDLQTDEKSVLNCLICQRLLNSKAVIEQRFPTNLDNILRTKNNLDAFNHWLFVNKKQIGNCQENNGTTINLIGNDVYETATKLIGKRIGFEDSVYPDKKLFIPMSTVDRDFIPYNNTSLEIGNPNRKLTYETNENIWKNRNLKRLMNKITTGNPNGKLIKNSTNNINGEAAGSLVSSDIAIPRVYFLNPYNNSSLDRPPDICLELLNMRGRKFGQKWLPNLSHLMLGSNGQKMHLTRVMLPLNDTTERCNIYCSCRISDWTESISGNSRIEKPDSDSTITNKPDDSTITSTSSVVVEGCCVRLVILKVEFSDLGFAIDNGPWKARILLRPHKEIKKFKVFDTSEIPLEGTQNGDVILARVLSNINDNNPGRKHPVSVDIIIPKIQNPLDSDQDIFGLRATKLRRMMLFKNNELQQNGATTKIQSLQQQMIGGDSSTKFDKELLLEERISYRDLVEFPLFMQCEKVFTSPILFQYLFPIHLPTCSTGEDFVVTPEVVALLRSDPAYVECYARCVEIILDCWGYDLVKGRTGWVPNTTINTSINTSIIDSSETNTTQFQNSVETRNNNTSSFHTRGFGKKSTSSGTTYGSSSYGPDPDGWKLRHLLLSLRIFRIETLYEIVAEIGQDILSNGILLNLQDQGFEESLVANNGDAFAARLWLERCLLNGNYSRKWIPTLEELLFAI